MVHPVLFKPLAASSPKGRYTVHQEGNDYFYRKSEESNPRQTKGTLEELNEDEQNRVDFLIRKYQLKASSGEEAGLNSKRSNSRNRSSVGRGARDSRSPSIDKEELDLKVNAVFAFAMPSAPQKRPWANGRSADTRRTTVLSRQRRVH